MKIQILQFCMLIGAVSSSSIVKFPTNTTGTLGGTAKFVCEVDYEEGASLMNWLFDKIIIYSYVDYTVTYPLRTNKYVVSDSHTIFTLEVRNLNYSDGGNYICEVTDQKKSAALIVLGSPIITQESTNLMEGMIATYVCEARFGGPIIDTIVSDHYPQMMLFLDDVFYPATSKFLKESVIRKIYEILMDDSMDTKNLKCEIGTTEPKLTLTALTVVNVLYSVRNTTYEPQEEKYEFGSNITCSARGNPFPLFEWRNIKNPEMMIKGQLLPITDDMEGKNSWTCTARNSVGIRMYEDEVTATFEAVSNILQEEAYLYFLIAIGCAVAGGLVIIACKRCSDVNSKFKHSKVTASFYVTTVATVIGSSFPHGWSMGVLNIPQKLIKKFIDESFTDHYGYKPSSDQLEMLWAVCVSIYLISGCFGIFIAGKLADKLGSKRALLFCHPFEIMAAVLFGICKITHSFELLIVGRIIIGFCCGAGSRLVLMYLVDIAPDNIQDEVLMLDWFGITLGILLSQIAGLRHCLGNESLWPILLALTALPSLASFLILPYFPQWPSDHLMKYKNEMIDPQKAQKETDDPHLANNENVNDESVDPQSFNGEKQRKEMKRGKNDNKNGGDFELKNMAAACDSQKAQHKTDEPHHATTENVNDEEVDPLNVNGEKQRMEMERVNNDNKNGNNLELKNIVAECDSKNAKQEKVNPPPAKVSDERIDAESPEARLIENDGEHGQGSKTSHQDENIHLKKAKKAYETFQREGNFEKYKHKYMAKEKVTERQLFQKQWKHLSPCLILLCGLNLCQRLSGIYIVFYYSLSLFEASGVPQDIIEYCVLSTGVINVLTTGVSIVGDFEHRHLLLIGMSIMIVSSLLMTLALHLQIFFLSILSINMFVLGFALGFGSVTTYIGRKLFFAGPRTPAITIAHSCNWFFNFIVALVYPVLQLRAGPNSFWIFTCFLVISIIFVFIRLPKTKKRNMREVYEDLGIKIGDNWPIDDDQQEEETNQPEKSKMLKNTNSTEVQSTAKKTRFTSLSAQTKDG